MVRSKWQDGHRKCASEGNHGGPGVGTVFLMDNVLVILWRFFCYVESGMFFTWSNVTQQCMVNLSYS